MQDGDEHCICANAGFIRQECSQSARAVFLPRPEVSGHCSQGSYGDDDSVLLKTFIGEQSLR